MHRPTSFAALLAHPGVEEVCELRSAVGVMAFHGGNLERGTDVVAEAAAKAAGASLYAVLQPEDLRWHIPSTAVDPAASEAFAAFVAHVELAVAVHGYGRDGWWTRLLVGGANRSAAAVVGSSLRAALTVHGYDVVDDIETIPSGLRGLHPKNPVNLPASAGVQLELPPRVRGQSPLSQPVHTTALVDGLSDALGRLTAPAA